MVNKEFIYLLHELFAMALGNLIKRLRIAKDLKQSTVARRLGITQQAYSKLENGYQAGTHRLPEILKAMDSTEEELTEVSKLFTPPPKRRKEIRSDRKTNRELIIRNIEYRSLNKEYRIQNAEYRN